MSFLTEYKDEVGSITLSAEFKEDLKKLCIAEAERAAGEPGRDPDIEVSEPSSAAKEVYSRMKLYKYISIAACIVAAVSSIGVVSLMTSRLKTSSDLNHPIAPEAYAADGVDVDASDSILEENVTEDEDDIIDSGSADNPAEAANGFSPMYDEPVQSSDETEAPDISVQEPAVESDEPVDDETAADAANYSVSMNSPDYDGDYNTEDYVLMLNSSARGTQSIALFDSVDGLENAVPNTDFGAESGSLDDYNALNFYDLLATALKEESRSGGASLVRMRVMGIADDSGSPAPYASEAYTPYDVNIEYDYLNQTGCDVDARVWIKGTADNQIKGMPTYADGDVILTSLYVNENGSVTVVDELLYDVYNLSGQDIAYHRRYERINPGYTDMGILNEERAFVTTTENNPVEYVHKAVTKELSRYIRRKIVGENYSFADLSWLGKVSVGEAEPWHEPAPDETQEPDPDETQEPQENTEQPEVEPIKNARVKTLDEKMIITVAEQTITLYDEASCEYIETQFKNSASSTSSAVASSAAMFVGGKLTFNSPVPFRGGLTEIEITSVGCPLDLSFNGVSVGDSLESAVNTLGIKEPLDQNCTLTYKGETLTATMKFEYGTLAKIVIK